jgi:hypothetical protein
LSITKGCPKAVLNFLPQHARDQVHTAAGRQGDDKLDGLIRELALRNGPAGEREGAQRASENEGSATRQHARISGG